MFRLIQNSLRILFIVGALTLSVQCSEQCATTPPEIPYCKIQEADIVFRLGRTLQSDAIASHGSGGYSHIGIIIRTDSTLKALHIEPHRHQSEHIKAQSLEEFFHPDNALAGCVMRHNAINDSLRLVISAYAKELHASPITFDHDYRLSDSSQMYCTELVEKIFQRVGISLARGQKIRLPLAKEPVIMPSAIYENDSLSMIWSYRLE